MTLRRLFWPLCAILLLVMATGLFVNNRSSNAHEEASRSARPSSTSEQKQNAGSGSPLPAEDRSLLNDRVKAFSALYFSPSSARSAEQVKNDVRQYATESFLQNAEFGFGTNQADLEMKREGASLRAEAISDLIGPIIKDRVILGTVTLRVTKYSRDGKAVATNTRQQEMKWVKPDKVWLILEAPRT